MAKITSPEKSEPQSLRVLMVEDSEDDAHLVIRSLKKGGYNPVYERVETAEAMRTTLREKAWDVILCDYQMPQFNGLAAIALLKETNLDIPLIIVSGAIGEETAVECMRLGASDFFMKGNLSRLAAAVERELKEAESRIQRKRAEEALRKSEEYFRAITENASGIILVVDKKGAITYASLSVERILGYKPEELISKSSLDLIAPTDYQRAIDDFGKAVLVKGALVPNVFRVRHKDGSERVLEGVGRNLYKNPSVAGFVMNVLDVTERKRAEVRAQLARDVLELLNSPEDSKETICAILQLIKKSTGFEAVGIRLREGNDFPYYKTNGFPEDFVEAERYLCARDEEEKVIRDGKGNPELECMCGNVICGRTDPALPFFTEGGSFWSNCTTELLASTTEEDRQARTRNRCNGEGYESVALIPLRSGDEIIGLLQLNDRRKNQFTSQMISFFEGLGASIGITLSRIRAEEAVRQSESHLRAILDATPFPIAIVDAQDTNIAFWSRSALTLFGHTAPTAPEWYQLAYPDPDYQRDVIERWKPFLEIARESGQTVNTGEYRVTCSDGSVRICELYATFLADKLIVTFSDITDRKQAEAAVRESEERFRVIFERSTVGKSLTTPEGTLMRINEAFADMLGYTIEEILELNFADITHPDDVAESWECIRSLLADEQTAYRFEKRYLHKNGDIIWADINTTLLRDEQRTPLYLITNIVDITTRKKAEEDLKKTLERLRRAVETTIQVIVSTIEARDPYTANHQLRSAVLASAIAKEMGFSQDGIEGIRIAGSVHDLGKLSIPAEILSKPTRLTDIEFSLIKEHSLKGYEMLKDVESLWPLAEIVYQHHERMDGSGYPRNLKGDEILMEARILAVCDVVEAMASHRPYRPGLGIDAALKEIEDNRGILYDTDVADICLRLFREKGFQFQS